MSISFRADDHFTADEIAKAGAIYARHVDRIKALSIIERDIVLPALPRINEKTKQKNFARCFTYILEFAIKDFK